jgi:hypothetical protein
MGWVKKAPHRNTETYAGRKGVSNFEVKEITSQLIVVVD